MARTFKHKLKGLWVVAEPSLRKMGGGVTEATVTGVAEEEELEDLTSTVFFFFFGCWLSASMDLSCSGLLLEEVDTCFCSLAFFIFRFWAARLMPPPLVPLASMSSGK